MKIFINNRNLLTWPRAMANYLRDQDHEVVFIDNGSSYAPLLEYYETCGHEVRRQVNLGPWESWRTIELQTDGRGATSLEHLPLRDLMET